MGTATTELRNSAAAGAVTRPAAGRVYQRWGKRIFDLIVSSSALVLAAPVIAVCAAAVRLTSGSPVFFRQTRVGRHGRLFKVLKFRTMRNGAETLGAAVVTRGDPRLTAVGGFLRRSKLDELPQLMNVLAGQMSIVGPRPRVPGEVNRSDPRLQKILSIRPGITSYASIHHRLEADYCARQADPQQVHRTRLIPQKAALDGEYAERHSLGLDLRLMALTFLLVLTPGEMTAGTLKIFGREFQVYGRAGQMVLDFAVFAGALWAAYEIRFAATLTPQGRVQMLLLILVLPGLRVALNKLLGAYDRMWRYINLADALAFALSLAPPTAALLLLRLGLPAASVHEFLLLVPLSVIALEYLISLTAGLGMRSLRRTLYVLHHHYQPLPEPSRRRVLILGAGLLGLSVAIELRQYPHLEPLGFLDDDPSKFHRILAGLRVLGNSEDFEAVARRRNATDLVICAKSLSVEKLQSLLQRTTSLGIKVRQMHALDRVLEQEEPGALHARSLMRLVGTKSSQNEGRRL